MFGWLNRLDPIARAVARNRVAMRERAGLHRRTTALPDGRRVVYLDAETDRPPLVLLHGIGASKDHWPRLAHRLEGRFRIVAPDLPGFGESDRTGPFDLPAQAEAVRAFVDELGIDRFHLAGSSMGGRVAAEVAARHPERVRTLWLLDPAGARGEALSEMIQTVQAGGDVPLFAKTGPEYAAVVAYTMETPPPVPRVALRVLGAEMRANYDLHLQIFRQMAEAFAVGPTTEALLAGVDVPTLVTWGAADRVLHPSGAHTIAAAMPDARPHVMPGVGHLPHLENPDDAADAYLAFLQGVAERRPERLADR